MRRTGWWLIVVVWAIGASNPALAEECDSQTKSLPHTWPKLLRGVVYLFAGHYDQTVAACDEVLQADPRNLCAYALRGYAHLHQPHGSRLAIADFSEALRRDPENVVLHIARARAYRQEKEYDHAIADCDEAIRLDPQCALAYAWRGSCYSQKHVIGKPLADYTTALRLDPQQNGTRCMRAEVFHRKGEIAKALDDLEEVLRSDPENKEALIRRYFIFLTDLHEYDRVIAETTALHRSDPKEAAWYILRNQAYDLKGKGGGRALLGMATAAMLYPGKIKFSFSCDTNPVRDEDQERIVVCTKRLRDDPNNGAALYERACAYWRKNLNQKAAADMNTIIRRDPADAVAYRLRGLIHCDLKDYVAAVADCNTAIMLDPNNVENYLDRGRAYAGQQKYDEAVRDLKKASQLDPKCKLAHRYLGWLLATRGDRDKSIADLIEAIAENKKTLELHSGDEAAHINLAWCLATCPDAKLRDGKKALRHATFACQVTYWKKPGYLVTLAEAYAECGDFEQAIKWQSKALELAQKKDKTEYRERLELYQAHKAYHLSFSKKQTSSEQ